MPQNQRQLRQVPFACGQVEVRMAHATSLDLNEDFTRARPWIFHVFDDQRSAGLAKHGSFHRQGFDALDRKSTRLNSSHGYISYAVFCLKKKTKPGLADLSRN